MKVHLLTPDGFRFEQTNQWPVAPKEGFPTAKAAEPEKLWHFTATTGKKAKTRRIAAIMVVGDEDEKPNYQLREVDGNIIELRTQATGGPAIVRINLGTGQLDAAPLLEVRCRNEQGHETVFKTE